ncbi:hypothetical protein [Paraburkholderia aromaticivorans]|uniref:hypothetical protein n=1 Tax=Paraburkholderia aromaticivorans TaxID=2026199 RepID=UPI001455FC65|nr:hypothetical protein [Paraburkholderia aromaticivorans]
MKVEDNNGPACESRESPSSTDGRGDAVGSPPGCEVVREMEIHAEIRFPDGRDEIIDLQIEELGGARPPEHVHHHHHHGGGGTHPHLVVVEVDNRKVEVTAGDYVVAAFKVQVGVAADRLLDRVLGPGKFEELADDQTIQVCAGEVFISHVKQGSSS